MVSFFISIYAVNMIEWCYQWDDPEYVTKYYEGLKRVNNQTGSTSWELAENFWHQIPNVKEKEDKDYRKVVDAKDAMYFIDL